MSRITWKHSNSSDLANMLGHGIIPTMETRHPEGNILSSELPRAKSAARRAYARHYEIPVRDVTTYTVMGHNGGAACVVAYVKPLAGSDAAPTATGEPEPESSKFSDVPGECAYAVALHGFAEEFGDVATLSGWNALVDISPVILRSVGESEHADRLAAWFTFRGITDSRILTVWIREDGQGQVATVGHAYEDSRGDRSYGTGKLEHEWLQAYEEYDDDTCAECGESLNGDESYDGFCSNCG